MKKSAIRPWRRMVQGLVALAFIAIPLLNRAEIHLLTGNFFSFRCAGLPLADPLAAAQVMAGARAATGAMLTGAGLSLLLALLLGPVFCSWICPFGLFSELTQRCGGRSGKAASASLLPFATKGLIAAAGLLAVFLFIPFPLLNQLSLPGWYARGLQYAVLYKEILWGVALIPVVLLAEALSGRRFWCRRVCPQSVLISLSGAVLSSRLRVHFDRKRCTCNASDRPCLHACSLRLNPRQPGFAQRLQCTNCGDCVDACRTQGQALGFRFRHKTTART